MSFFWRNCFWLFGILTSTKSPAITANKGGSYYFTDLDIWRKEDYGEMVRLLILKLNWWASRSLLSESWLISAGRRNWETSSSLPLASLSLTEQKIYWQLVRSSSSSKSLYNPKCSLKISILGTVTSVALWLAAASNVIKRRFSAPWDGQGTISGIRQGKSSG